MSANGSNFWSERQEDQGDRDDRAYDQWRYSDEATPMHVGVDTGPGENVTVEWEMTVDCDEPHCQAVVTETIVSRWKEGTK